MIRKVLEAAAAGAAAISPWGGFGALLLQLASTRAQIRLARLTLPPLEAG